MQPSREGTHTGTELVTVRRLLLADDEDALRTALELILSRAGYEVTACSDGWSALEALEAALERGRGYDLAVLDVQMPGLTGPQVAERLARRYGRVAVLLVTGYGEEDVPESLRSQGVRDVIGKPFTPEQLLCRIHHLLQEP